MTNVKAKARIAYNAGKTIGQASAESGEMSLGIVKGWFVDFAREDAEAESEMENRSFDDFNYVGSHHHY